MVIAVVFGLLGACLLGCGAGAMVVWAGQVRSRRELPQPPDSSELVARVLEANRALLEQERLRATSELDGKKGLIDQQLVSMTGELGKVSDLVRELEHDRHKAFGALTNELQRQHEGLNALSEHTHQLREALANSRVRGSMGRADGGRRVAAGRFPRGRQLPQTGDTRRCRSARLHVPPSQRARHAHGREVPARQLRPLSRSRERRRARTPPRPVPARRCDRVKELTTRGYLDAADETVDCLLLFIPNEQVYSFVQENDRDAIDDAMRHKIVLCSPLTLYAVLAVVRQAVDNFRLERTSNEILGLLREFSLQWEKYATQLDRVQQRFDGVAKEYSALMTTRHRALQRPLDKIDSLRLEEPALVDPEIVPLALEA